MAADQTQLRGFFLVLDGSQAGPFTGDELVVLRDKGRFTGSTLVWKSGMGGWTKASEVAELSVLLDSPPPLPPTCPPQVVRGKQGVSMDDIAADLDDMEEDWFSSAPRPASVGPSSAKTAKPAKALRPPVDDAPFPEPEKGRRLDPFASFKISETARPGAVGSSADQAGTDPFFSVSSEEESGLGADVEVGEQTRFFMIQAGMTQKQRNPPWKIALYVAMFVGFPVAFLFALSQISVEQVYFDKETGREEKVEVSALEEVSEGFSDLKDKLLGVSKTDTEKEEEKSRRLSDIRKKKALNSRKKKAKDAPERLVMPTDVSVAGAAGGMDSLGRMGGSVQTASLSMGSAPTDEARAAALDDGDDRVMQKGPAVRQSARAAAAPLDGAPSLSPEVLAKVISGNQKAFQACAQNELRRNPGFKGGKVVLTLTIGSSGMVTGAVIDKPEVDKAVVGSCLKMSARRIVFPSFEGEPFNLEVPLVLSSGF